MKEIRSALSRVSAARVVLASTALMSLAFAVQFLIDTASTRGQSEARVAASAARVLPQGLVAATAHAPASVADVVAKALAFKAMLTSTQQATLELAYTATLARRWSNLPCGATCRNGIALGSLTAEQLAAALEVIRAAAGTQANEGAAEFNQIRLADTLLGAQGGAGGPGGGGYGAGFYYLAFLNTPSATGPWMMQYGGHHYGANIAFNQGHVVSTTPLFLALEPLTFTANGSSYAPLAEERDALAAMMASLTATQLAAAKLTTTFSDTTMSPGESNGGNGTFPTVKVGIAVSSLSSAQKQLVAAAMKPWVQDMDDTVAANLMSIYQNELEGTYIAFTGNGVAADASSFLVANTNYVRIDGPSVWIEFVCQNGVVFRNQIHYHTVWRDHSRDYGKDLSLTVPLDSSSTSGAITTTSAASYATGSLAPESIGIVFGSGFASATVSASTTPLPTTLANAQVQVTDSAGASRNAPLFYVTPTQIAFQVPAGTSAGTASIAVALSGAVVSQTTTTVESVAPGVFSANANGQGVVAGTVVRVKADGSQSEVALLQYNQTAARYEAVPLDLGDATDQLYLVAYGTGFRNRSSLANVAATIGGANADVIYAGPQGGFAGLDQTNIRIPRSLAGRGSVDVVLSVDNRRANTVTINVK